MDRRKDSKGRRLYKGESERKDGRYMYRFTDGTGKRRCVYSRSLPDLREKERKIALDLNDGIIPCGTATLNEVYRRYMECIRGIKDNTRGNYEYIYEHYVMEELGKRKIREIRYSDLRLFYNGLMDRGLGLRTLQKLQSILHPVFELAVRDGLIRKNPSDGLGAELRKSYDEPPDKPAALTEGEENRLLDFLRNSEIFKWWYVLISVLLKTGIRIGELIALRWQDLDFKKQMIRIRLTCVCQSHGKGKKGPYISSPKTRAGRREIPMSSELRSLLLKEWERQAAENSFNRTVLYDQEGKAYSGFIFSNKDGGILSAAGVNRALRRITAALRKEEAKEAGKRGSLSALMPSFSAHQLRHTFCTRLCERETNLKVIQEIMGHSDIRVTMNVYAEATAERKREAMERLRETED